MKTILSATIVLVCLVQCATVIADSVMPSVPSSGSTNQGGATTLERDTTGQILDDTTAPDSGSTMTQQRMEEDRNDGRSRDAMKRQPRYWTPDDSKPTKRLSP